MPVIRLTVSEYYTFLTSSIALNGEIMSPCSYCVKKGLVYVIITELSNYQPSFCSECTKLNTCVLYNVHSVSFNKCIFFTCLNNL